MKTKTLYYVVDVHVGDTVDVEVLYGPYKDERRAVKAVYDYYDTYFKDDEDVVMDAMAAKIEMDEGDCTRTILVARRYSLE